MKKTFTVEVIVEGYDEAQLVSLRDSIVKAAESVTSGVEDIWMIASPVWDIKPISRWALLQVKIEAWAIRLWRAVRYG